MPSSLPSLLCPSCGARLLQTAPPQLNGICAACGWRAWPQWTAPLPPPPFPPQKNLLCAGLGQVWAAGEGGLLAFAPSAGQWRALPVAQVAQVSDLRHVRGLAFAGERLVLAPAEPNPLGPPKALLGLEAQDGVLRWRVESQALEWTAPALSGSLLCAVDSLGQAAVLDPQSGAPRWENPPSLGGLPRRAIPPVWSRSFLLLVTPQGELIWLRRRDGRPAGNLLPPAGPLDFAPACREDQAWFCAGEALYLLDLRRGQVRELFRAPRRAAQGWYFTAPQITPQGILLAHADWDQDGRPAYALRLLEAESGQTRWQLPLPRHPYFAPALEGERLALPDRDGHLLLIDLLSGEVKLRLALGEEKPAASPLFLDGEIYLLTESGGVLRFSPHLRLEHLPESAEAYLARGEWQAAALRRALQGDLNGAAALYKIHQHLAEARALYEMADNHAEVEGLTRLGADFRLSLHADTPLQEGAFSLLTLRLQNLGNVEARSVWLTLSSPQMEITTPRHSFGLLLPGESKTWESLQVRPQAGQRGELLLRLTLTWRNPQGKPHKAVFEQGLTVLQAESPASREIHIHIGGDVSNSVLIVGDRNVVNQQIGGKT